MNHLVARSLIGMLFAWSGLAVALADTVVLHNGRSLIGTVVRTNGDDVLLVMDHAAFNFSRGSIKELKTDQMEVTELRNTNRIPAFKFVLAVLSKQAWASDIRPIPATVIDKGMLRNVPYESFRCADDYEVNIYGDLSHPAGVEAGVYHKLTSDNSAKSNCVQFITALMGQVADGEMVQGLNMERNLKVRQGLTFETTPPEAEDAYMGWWISVYSEKELKLARASDEELKEISVPKTAVAKQTTKAEDPSTWSADDLKFARPEPVRISFVTESGEAISNAEVKPYIEGVSLIWKTENGSGGIVKLADLPEELRVRYGYDPAKTAVVKGLERDRQAQDAQKRAAQAVNAAEVAQVQSSGLYDPGTDRVSSHPAAYSSFSQGSGGGSVYVHGYTRKNGTYVHGYTRRR